MTPLMVAAVRSDLPEGWDDLVAASRDLDRFCSGTDWTLAAREAFGAGQPILAGATEGAAVGLLCGSERRGPRVLVGLDPLWGFACPVVGPDPAAGAELLASLLEADRKWLGTLVTGVVPGSAREAALIAALARRYALARGPSMTRQVARLEGSAEGWLARRGSTFRRNLRRAVRRADAAGVELIIEAPTDPGVIDRAVAIDRRSWKGRRRSGLADPSLQRFYRSLAERLAPRGRLRAGFAHVPGRGDVGYILGGVAEGTYRGFQLAYDDEAGELSIGNLLQWAQLRALAAEHVERYDLGMDMAYKRSWADEALSSFTLVVQR